MNVYVLTTGNIDTSEEPLCNIYREEEDAKGAALGTIISLFDEDNLADDGYTYDEKVMDDGSWTVAMIDPGGKEIEWWRVREEEVI